MVYKDGTGPAENGVIEAEELGSDGTVDHEATVYLKCKTKDYVDIFEADTNLHAYKCDATSTKDIKVMGEMFKECKFIFDTFVSRNNDTVVPAAS